MVNGEDFVNENHRHHILYTHLQPSNIEKPLIAYAQRPAKASKDFLTYYRYTVHKGVNLGDVMKVASEKFGGKGNNIAAGGQVALDKVDEFVKIANELVGRQLKGEKVAGNNNP